MAVAKLLIQKTKGVDAVEAEVPPALRRQILPVAFICNINRYLGCSRIVLNLKLIAIKETVTLDSLRRPSTLPSRRWGNCIAWLQNLRGSSLYLAVQAVCSVL